jgi:peptide/nickel transport system permease protein
MGLRRYLATRGIILFCVLMMTLLLTIMLVGSNMDIILKKGVSIQIRSEITENKSLMNSFKDTKELDQFIQNRIDERIKTLGLDYPWY